MQFQIPNESIADITQAELIRQPLAGDINDITFSISMSDSGIQAIQPQEIRKIGSRGEAVAFGMFLPVNIVDEFRPGGECYRDDASRGEIDSTEPL